MRVVIYINIMERGGAEGQVAVLAEGLLERGYEVKIATGSGKLTAVPDNLLPYVIEIPERPRLKRFWAFFRFLREYKPDVLHNQLYMANVFGTLAGRLAGVKTIIMSVLSTDLWKGKTARILEKRAAALASKVMVNSRGVARDLLEQSNIPQQKIHVIYNGIDTVRFSPDKLETYKSEVRRELKIPGDAPVIINVANLLPVKNHQTLLRAIALLERNMPNRRRPFLILCGEGPEKENIIRLAADLGTLPFIRFTGSVTDVERYLGASDIFCLPSSSEGFSNAKIEAMAMGLPCIVSDVGGNAEAVIDGINGYVTLSGDIEMTSIRLRDLILDEEKAREMGRAGRDIAVSNFSEGRMIMDTIEMYEGTQN
ncbi:MAG: glycosyltransferase [bacterium]|nr:glycosyltransferase [bacterium]